ncbi:MAG TPA: hypothetical protein VFP01_08010, partial [Propionibacteriaceae bacterium]|nr:hypothetical protein [Propionibacteriaceae bacterium]
MGSEGAEMRAYYAHGSERDRLGDPKGEVEFEGPPEPRLRAPTLGDVAAVTTLLNRVADTDQSGWIDEEALRGWFTNPHSPIAEGAVLPDIHELGGSGRRLFADQRLERRLVTDRVEVGV